MSTPLVYMTRSETSDEFEVPRREWYRRRHSTDIIGVGFWSARAYRATAIPRNWSVYEIPDVSLLSSDAYMEMRRNDTFSPTVMKSFSYMSASVYTQVWVGGENGRVTDAVPSLRGAALSLMKFDLDDSAAVNEWFQARVVEPYGGVSDVATVRLWEQRDAHPLFPPKEPRWCVAVEWASAARVDNVWLARAMKNAPSLINAGIDAGIKWYGLMREDVFVSASDQVAKAAELRPSQ